jgi:iron complex outermembrane receptor protein
MKFFIRAVLLVIVLTSIHPVNGQNTGSVIGIVIDGFSDDPLPGVTVYVNEVNGTITDASGKYMLELEPGEYEIRFSFIGYYTHFVDVLIDSAEARIINIKLHSAETNLGTVVVSAGRYEQAIEDVVVSMEVLKPQLAGNKNATTLETAIEQVPGVNVIDGQANIRGGSGYSYGAGSRVQVLMNDIPVLAADANDVKWTFLPVETIGQVEVIKGASSALYGSSAMNGVINLRTAEVTDTPETRFSFFYGWYGEPRREQLKWWGDETQELNGLMFSHKERINRFDLNLGGQVFQDEGYRMGENEKRYRVNGGGRLSFPKTPGLYAGINTNVVFSSGGLMFLWENDSSGAYIPQGGLDDSTTTLSLYETTRTGIDPYITYTTPSGKVHKLKTRYFRSSNRNNTGQESTATMYYSEYQFQARITDELMLTSGIVNLYSDVKSELYEDHYGNNASFYLQADYSYGKLNASVGARVENNTVDGGNSEAIPVFRSGLSYRIAPYTYLRASAGQGYRYPSIAERFISTNVGGIVIYPNDSLESEKGWTAEIGIRQGFRISKWKGLLDVAAFWSEYQDMLEFTFGFYGSITDPNFGAGFQSQNIGNTEIKGIDISVSGSGNVGKLPMTILAGYTYIDPRSKDFDPTTDTLKNSANYNILKYRYKHTFKADIEVTPGKFTLGMSSRYNSFMENIDAVFESLIPGVKQYRERHDYGDWVFDGRLGYSFTENVSFWFICDNLFNHEYMGRPADMMPPRTYTFKASFRY